MVLASAVLSKIGKCFSSCIAAIDQWPTSDKIAFANSAFTLFFLLATIISVVCAFKAYKHQKDRSRKEAACNLARYYAENIIFRHSFVEATMRFATIDSNAKELFPYQELFQFNKTEMLGFLDRSSVPYNTAKNIFLNIDPQAVLNAKLAFSSSIQERRDIIQEYIVKDAETGEKRVAFSEALQDEFFDKVYNFLNDLEWFSMSCRYGISDEEILYQSLHKTFLSTVWLLYFYICDRNHTNEDKLFTNVIWLFNKWRRRLIAIQKDAEKKQAKAEKKIRTAERKRAAAEQELSHAEPKVHSGRPLKK